MKKTLLAKAQEIGGNREWTVITSEDTELVFAHLLGIVTIPQIQKVKGIPPGNSIYSYMFRALRAGFKNGDIYKRDRGSTKTITNIT